MKRGLVVDTVLTSVVSVGLLWLGSHQLPAMALEAVRANLVVDGPDVLSRFQQRLGWAWAVVPVMGWVALLPVHLRTSPTLVRRLATLVLPVLGAAAWTVFEVQRLVSALELATVVKPLVGIESLPLVRAALVGGGVVAALLFAFDSRARRAV